MNSSADPSDGMDPDMLAAMTDGAYAEGRFWIFAGIALAGAATVAVILRLLARRRTISTWSKDDLCICLSLIPLWCLVGVGIIMANQGGMGLLASMLSPSQSYVFYRTLFASLMLYALAITAVKISVLLLYHRIFAIQSFRFMVYIVGTACILWFLVVIFVGFFQCRPISYAWDHTNEGVCIDLKAMYLSFTISNMVLDIAINFMPIRLMWKLRLPLKQRILLIVVMLLGIIVIVASIGRIGSVPNLIVSDVSATIMMPLLYTVIEPAFAIICACLVTYKPLVILLSPARLRTFFSSLSRNPSSNRSRSHAHFPIKPDSNPSDLFNTRSTPSNPFNSTSTNKVYATTHTNSTTDAFQTEGAQDRNGSTNTIELKEVEVSKAFAERMEWSTRDVIRESQHVVGGMPEYGAHGNWKDDGGRGVRM